MKKKLDQYTGPLHPGQIAEGMNAAINNSARLLEDAIILFDASRYPSACALAILSIEEAGKASILRGMSCLGQNNEFYESWKNYRNHTKKNAQWMLPSLVLQGAKSLSDLSSLFDTSSEHPYILDQLKQVAFYTDCLGKAHWSKPIDVIDKELAQMIIFSAKALCQNRYVTIDEIKLWVKNLKPVWGKSQERMKIGLTNWRKECIEIGLIVDSEYEFNKFVYGE